MIDSIILGQTERLFLRMANRHGLITGATGTGKTVTLQTMAEGFSAAGVPVFAADVKGDLSGLSQKGAGESSPVIFWDIFGKQGHPIRTTIESMGPFILSRLMGLTAAQEGALNIAFKIAKEEGLALLDLKDLRALLANLATRGGTISTEYGNVTNPTIGALQRQLVVIEEQGGASFFGEPALDIADFMKTDSAGRGFINILAADKLTNAPQLYATFLFWLLTELFEKLPEAGDSEKPKLVFFFDEAHLLFAEASKGLLQKIQQTVKLVRSKGVGVYFVTQNPLDVPDGVLEQMGNRIQHALRAYTARSQKAVKAAATTFRANPAIDTIKAIMEMGKGEALVSVLDLKGVPATVSRTHIKTPASRMGAVSVTERAGTVRASPLVGKYETAIDRESAFEILEQRKAIDSAAEGPSSFQDVFRAALAARMAAKASGASPGLLRTLGRLLITPQ